MPSEFIRKIISNLELQTQANYWLVKYKKDIFIYPRSPLHSFSRTQQRMCFTSNPRKRKHGIQAKQYSKGRGKHPFCIHCCQFPCFQYGSLTFSFAWCSLDQATQIEKKIYILQRIKQSFNGGVRQFPCQKDQGEDLKTYLLLKQLLNQFFLFQLSFTHTPSSAPRITNS